MEPIGFAPMSSAREAGALLIELRPRKIWTRRDSNPPSASLAGACPLTLLAHHTMELTGIEPVTS
jgi:hypothetical protein